MYNASRSDPGLTHAERRLPPSCGSPAAADRPGAPGLGFTVDPGLVLKVGFGLAFVFVVASAIGRMLLPGLGAEGGLLDAYVEVTDVNREGSVPTWFQSSCLLACSALLWTVGAASRRAGLQRRYAWRLLSAAFLYLSVDEAVELHERVNRPLRDAYGLDGVLYFSWVVVAVPMVLLLGFVLVPWLRELPRRTSVAFLVSGAVYTTGSVGVELVGALLWRGVGKESLAYAAATTVEEALEMTGMLLFLAAVAAYHQRHLLPATTVPAATSGGTSPRTAAGGSSDLRGVQMLCR